MSLSCYFYMIYGRFGKPAAEDKVESCTLIGLSVLDERIVSLYDHLRSFHCSPPLQTISTQYSNDNGLGVCWPFFDVHSSPFFPAESSVPFQEERRKGQLSGDLEMAKQKKEYIIVIDHRFVKNCRILPFTLCFWILFGHSHTVDGQNPAPPHHFTLEGSHSNPRAPSVNVGATPLRRWCRILDLQLVFVFSLWWRDPSEEVVQDFGPSTCFCFLTVVARPL